MSSQIGEWNWERYSSPEFDRLHEDAVAADDGGFGIQFGAQRRSDLDRLDAAAEGLGERAVHSALESLLEAVK